MAKFIPKNANSGGSATCILKDLLPDDALVTHVVTCQGRDHVVSIRSGCRSLVIVNVHFEPELTLRSLRERSRRITPHWQPYPSKLSALLRGICNICEPEEGRFNVWNQSCNGRRYGEVCFLSFLFSSCTRKLRSPTSQGKTHSRWHCTYTVQD